MKLATGSPIRLGTGIAAMVLVLADLCRADRSGPAYTLTPTKVGHELKTPAGKTVLQYMTGMPEDSNLTANSTCCLYPVFTPKGTRVIDFAPDDHKHHRGIFLAWHHIQGDPGGDFWGWGKFAPTAGRIIARIAPIVGVPVLDEEDRGIRQAMHLGPEQGGTRLASY